MVDSVASYTPGAHPVVIAERTIRASEPLFSDGAVREWPAVYVIEGMGQASMLLSVLRAYEKALDDVAEGPETCGDILHRFASDGAPVLDEVARTGTRPGLGVLAAVDVEILSPVRIGDVLQYRAELSHVLGELVRFETCAFVRDREVARGSIIAANVAATRIRSNRSSSEWSTPRISAAPARSRRIMIAPDGGGTP